MWMNYTIRTKTIIILYSDWKGNLYIHTYIHTSFLSNLKCNTGTVFSATKEWNNLTQVQNSSERCVVYWCKIKDTKRNEHLFCSLDIRRIFWNLLKPFETHWWIRCGRNYTNKHYYFVFIWWKYTNSFINYFMLTFLEWMKCNSKKLPRQLFLTW